MISQQLENAKKLYLRGIRDGEIKEVQDNYMGETYTQHSTGVKDEKAGFAEFFTDFFKRNPKRELEIVRAFEDGEFVFLHVHQNLNDGQAQWVTTDIFRADEAGKIVEHWDVIEAYPAEVTGLDLIFGEFALKDLEQTEANKKQVRHFLVDVLQNKEIAKFDEYVAKDLLQHDSVIGQGGTSLPRIFTKNKGRL